MTKRTRRLRWRFQGRAVLLLALFWVMLWGEASLINIVVGLVIGWLITVVFWLTPIRYYGRFHLGRALVLLATQMWDLARASVELAAVAFRPKLELKPGIIGVPLRIRNDLLQVAIAELISIVPGTLVVETTRHPRMLYLHVFDLSGEGAIARERAHAQHVEERLVRAFGSPHDIAALEADDEPDSGRPGTEPAS